MKILDYLTLPDACKYDVALTKVFFKRNFMLTRADKTFLEDAPIFQEMRMYGSIKPDNLNIQAYLSDTETYEEIGFISVKTDAETFERNHQKIATLIQKYIPYHLLISVEADDDSKFSLHLARKNISRNNRNERVVTESIFTAALQAADTSFMSHFALSKLSKVNIRTLYNDYIALLYSKQIAELTKSFQALPYNVAMERMIVLREIAEKEQNLAILRTQIKKETQLNEQVKLNTRIHQLREEIKELTNCLS